MKHFFQIFVCFFVSSQCYKQELLIDRIRSNFLSLENEVWKHVLSQHKDNAIDPGLEIVKRFQDFNEQVQLMPQDTLYGMDVPRQAKKFLILYSDIRVIHDLYDKFRRYLLDTLSPTQKDYFEYRRGTKTSDIVDDILHDVKNNVNKTTLQVFEQTFGSKYHDSLVLELLNIISAKDYMCNNPTQPAQQVFYNLYNAIALTDFKGYILTQFAYMAQRLQETGNYTEASLKAREEYKIRTKSMISTIASFMEITNGNIYRCDPKVHKEGETYSEVTQLLQAHIQNEVDLNPSRTCTDNCAAYSSTLNYGCYDKASEYCKKMKPCNGRIYDCRFVESDLKACIAPGSSLRRYEYIQYQSGKVLGERSRCSQRSSSSWIRWFVHCSNCLCLCDQQGALSDRYFSLRLVTSDTKKNRVVTGMRLVKHNRIFHIQVQEGTLLPHGYIDQNTTRWVPVDEYKITDPGVANGQDYFTMDYYNRNLLLDDLEAEKDNYIITGARFISRGDLQFRITITPFNFSTGQLYTDESYEVSKKSVRQRIEFSNPNIPIYSTPSEPNFERGRYIRFTNSDLAKDAGQTTVPFIDIQPAYANPAVPLRSAGIYYKGNPGYGGFIGMKVGTYDYTSSLIFDFPNPTERKDSEEVYGVIPN